MRRSLSLVTAPATEPVTLDELKLFARIDGDDEDDLLEQFIAAARVAAEDFTRRAFVTQGWRMTLDLPGNRWANDLPEGRYELPVTALNGDLSRTIDLPRPPILSVASVTSYDLENTSSTYAPSNYTVDTAGGRLVLNYGALWPTSMRPTGAMEIVTTNGYGAADAVPKPIKTAIMIHAAKLHEERGMCGDELPDGCRQLLRQYRVERL